MKDGQIAQSGTYDDLLRAGTELDILVQAHKDAMDLVDTNRASNVKGDDDLTSGDGELSHEMLDKLQSAAIEPSDGVGSPPVGSPRATGIESISHFQHTSRRSRAAPHVVHGLQTSEDVKKGTAKLIDEERRERGRVGWSVYWLYFTSSYGWPAVAAVLVLQLVWQSLIVASDYWLAYETSSDEEAQFQPRNFILGYFYLSLGIWAAAVFRTVLVIAMGIISAQSFFHGMLRCVFRAPMSFFDTTPTGRILSRVSLRCELQWCSSSIFSLTDARNLQASLWLQASSDQTTLDILLTFLSSGSLAVFAAAIATLVVLCQVTWQVIFVIVPLAYIYLSYQVL